MRRSSPPEHEMGIINRMGFDTYFLIVWDLCEWAARRDDWYERHQDLSPLRQLPGVERERHLVECARVGRRFGGSVHAGHYQPDPLVNGLIFERFLNPGRVSMPDIDLDYPDDARGLMVAYTKRRYGAEKGGADHHLWHIGGAGGHP
ncbi:MAG: hypothetical protein M5U34_36685 [Chloroflexi bacterium]|nr:hypothetical protein [Chloroflexota bacterium]